MNSVVELSPRYLPTGWDDLVAQPGWLIALGLLLAIAAAGAVWLGRRERAVVGRTVGAWLLGLRWVALAAVAAAVVGVERRPVTERTTASRVVVLVDASASMTLPGGPSPALPAGGPTRSAAAAACAAAVTEALSASHEVVVAGFGAAVRRVERRGDEVLLNALRPTDDQSRLGDAIQQVLADNAGAPLGGVVVLSDGRSTGGVDPAVAARDATPRRVPIHAVGFGALVEPPTVELAGFTAPRRVVVGDPFPVSALAVGRGGFAGKVEASVELRRASPSGGGAPVDTRSASAEVSPQTPAGALALELDAPAPGEYVVAIRLGGDAAGAEPLEAPIEVVERKSRVLLLAGGPSRDYRFLRDELHRDEAFAVDVLLQSASAGVVQDAEELLPAFPTAADELNGYDAVVAFDADWRAVGRPGAAALADWVARRGGGLLFVAGPGRTLAREADDPRSPLARLSPVDFGGDLLRVRLDTTPPVDAAPVRLTPAGEAVDFMRIDTAVDAASAWDAVGGLYARPPSATPKPAAQVYARLGRDPGAPPLLVEQFFGSGRVAYLATGETWRLRRGDPARFARFYTRLLRRLSQGRLLGAAARGRLFFDRDRYRVGETLRVRLTLGADEREQPGPPPLRWRSPDGTAEQARLAPVDGEAGAFAAQRLAVVPGRYEAAVELPDGLRLEAAAVAESPAREAAARVRDEATLRAIAVVSGGTYFAEAGESVAASIAAATPSRAETRTELGPADAAFGRSLHRALLLVAAVALTAEWALRRANRLA